MLRIILLLIPVLILGFSKPVFAVTGAGACSWHGGVNCGAGRDFDGSVVCKDGSKDSSVYFSDVCSSLSNRDYCYTRTQCDQIYGVIDAEITKLEQQKSASISELERLRASDLQEADNQCQETLARNAQLFANYPSAGTQIQTYNQQTQAQCDSTRRRIDSDHASLVSTARSNYDVFILQWRRVRAGVVELIPAPVAQPVVATPRTVIVAPLIVTTTVPVSTAAPLPITAPVVSSKPIQVPQLPKYYYGIPKNKTDLLNCFVVGNKKTKRFYLRGNKVIKALDFKNTLCFRDQDEAKKGKFTLTK